MLAQKLFSEPKFTSHVSFLIKTEKEIESRPNDYLGSEPTFIAIRLRCFTNIATDTDSG